MKHRFHSLLLCSLLSLFLALPLNGQANQAQTLSDVEQQILQTNTQLETLDQELARSRALKAELEDAVRLAESRVDERDQRLLGLESQIGDYNETLSSLETSVSQVRQGIEARQERLASVIRSAQSVGKQSSLKIILQHDDPALADRVAVYTEHVLRAHKHAIDEQLAVLNRIEIAHAAALKDRNWLNYIQKKAEKQRLNLAAKAKDTQTNLTQTQTSVSQKSEQLSQLRADQERLQTLMEELKALQSAQSGYFIAGKGQYPAPVNGLVTARFGEIKSVGKLRWNGLFISAEPGTVVNAVADGEVIYSDWLQGFGMLVIIDHGDGYSSLYGGNRDVTVPAGDWVESGSTIATVGDSGGQSASGVYFEIRHKALAEDPEHWLSPDSGLQSARK